ncbi:MAG: Rieske 2Fe-2S domain-containing protein [Halothece sp.]
MADQFNFFQHWYPLMPVEDLDPNYPTPITLLEQSLVVWKPRYSDQYQVFVDACPHRLAPLSEGRVDEKTGNLMCSYHGWQFDGEGNCTQIPQAENPDLIKGQSFCATSLPTQQANGLLWVWPDATSAEIAKEQPLPLSPQIDPSQGVVWSSMVRELAYDWQTLIENVADPSHVPFAHHGIQGNRDRATPVPMKILQSDKNCIQAEVDRGVKSTITFTPPCHLEYEIEIGSNRKLGLITYCLPVSGGRSRIIAQFSRNFAKRAHYLIPRWWEHIQTRNFVLDGDMILLHEQEKKLKQSVAESWKTAYQLPTTADRMVIEFRRWLDRYSPQLPWGQINPVNSDLKRDRNLLLDRYHQHTVICGSCRQALKNIHRLEGGLLTWSAIALVIATILPASNGLGLRLFFGLTALLSLGGYVGLKSWLEPRFYFVDYVHADR